MEIISFVISIIALFVAFGLKRRVDHLENLIKSRGMADRAETSSGVSPAPIPVPLADLTEPAPFEIGVPLGRAEIQKPSPFDAFVRWVQEDWLMKLGALLLLIGFGWLKKKKIIKKKK